MTWIWRALLPGVFLAWLLAVPAVHSEAAILAGEGPSGQAAEELAAGGGLDDPADSPAAATPTPHPAGLILPPDGFLPGWKRDGALLRFVGNDLYGHIDGGAELFYELGFDELLVQRYLGEAGSDGKGAEVSLEAYAMESPESALAIYLLRRGNETPVPGLPGRSTGSRYQLILAAGRFYIQVDSFTGEEALRPVMTELARQAVASTPESGAPALLELLPREGLLPGSELLFRGPYSLQGIFTFGDGDVLQQEGRIFGVAGSYASDGGERYTRLVIPYGDEAKARAAFRGLLERLDPAHTILSRGEGSAVFRDYAGRFGVVECRGGLLEIQINRARQPQL